MPDARPWIGLGLAATIVGLVGSPAGPAVSAHDPINTKVTWEREIAPLLGRRCLSCHTPGGYAGFSLATYSEARPWAVAIKEEVLSGDMPPWGAAAGIGHFANDRRLTRHEQELIATWVDGGAPYSLAAPRFPPPDAVGARPPPLPLAESSLEIPLAPTQVTEATERTASVTLQLPEGTLLTAWTFEPGIGALIEQVDFEVNSRWLGAWTPGEPRLTFPADAGAPLGAAALLTARIAYKVPPSPVMDYSRIRIWIGKDARPRTLGEVTVIKSWRAPRSVDLVAIRPAPGESEVQVVARFADGRAEPVGVLRAPAHAPHPTYRLARPLPLPLGTRIETTGPVRLLYSDAGTRTAKPNVRRRPRR